MPWESDLYRRGPELRWYHLLLVLGGVTVAVPAMLVVAGAAVGVVFSVAMWTIRALGAL